MPAPEPEQPREAAQRPGRDGERRQGNTGQERSEPRRVRADGADPQVVREGDRESADEIGADRVRERRGLPSDAVLLLRLLEVVADAAGVDAEQADLAGLG